MGYLHITHRNQQSTTPPNALDDLSPLNVLQRVPKDACGASRQVGQVFRIPVFRTPCPWRPTSALAPDHIHQPRSLPQSDNLSANLGPRLATLYGPLLTASPGHSGEQPPQTASKPPSGGFSVQFRNAQGDFGTGSVARLRVRSEPTSQIIVRVGFSE